MSTINARKGKVESTIPDEINDKFLEALQKKTVVKLRQFNSKNEIKIYELLKQPGFRVDQVYNVVLNEK